MTLPKGKGPSGVGGPLGAIADGWDRIPVKGAMAVAVGVVGTVLALVNGGPGQGACDTEPLQHVYHPSRLLIIEKCAQVTGTVVAYRHEHDGDYHVSMQMDGGGWTNAVNDSRQHGYTVVEFVPLEPMPKLRVGMRLSLVATKVYDQQHKPKSAEHGWIEGHPVFKYRVLSDGPAQAVPNRPQLAPPTEKEEG